MVSNASDDLPDPDRPVMTTSESRGSSTVTSLRLCSRAPETTMEDWGEGIGSLQSRGVADGFLEQTFASSESPANSLFAFLRVVEGPASYDLSLHPPDDLVRAHADVLEREQVGVIAALRRAVEALLPERA